MDSFLVETSKWSALVNISEGIIISTGNSLNWSRTKPEVLLWSWMLKTFGKEGEGWKRIRQENFT